MAKTRLTANRAASLTRQQISRKIKRMMLDDFVMDGGEPYINANDLLAWIRQADERANQKRGGLGRR